ncbi:MAG: acyl-[acyl-carrier-protein] thioesterase [Alistipes sp.]|jgi:acyl-ACP thioesterase|nr:acyl-[acyl-carrier-protein] thioesterase [Alistipes sp.]
MAGTYKYRIEPRDIDATLRARIYSIGDIVLQAAGDDADMLGFGVRDLNSGVGSDGVNASWVLSRMAVDMSRLPSRHEEIAVYTWISDYGRLMTTRNTVVADSSGQQIGAAVTQWAMIDLDTRKALDLSALAGKSASLVDREPPIERPRRLGALSSECALERSHTVVYSDIDFNGHAGSMKYLEWIIDTLPAGVVAGIGNGDADGGGTDDGGGVRFDINYLHEARLGEQLTICVGSDADGDHLFEIRNSEGAAICRAIISAVGTAASIRHK